MRRKILWEGKYYDKGSMYHEEEIVKREEVKTVAFIAGKKNPAIQKKIIRFSIEIKLKKWIQRR